VKRWLELGLHVCFEEHQDQGAAAAADRVEDRAEDPPAAEHGEGEDELRERIAVLEERVEDVEVVEAAVISYLAEEEGSEAEPEHSEVERSEDGHEAVEEREEEVHEEQAPPAQKRRHSGLFC